MKMGQAVNNKGDNPHRSKSRGCQKIPNLAIKIL
jgi:hypothetical protein